MISLPKTILYIGVLFIICAGVLVFERYMPHQIITEPAVYGANDVGYPQSISINSIKVNLPIVRSVMEDPKKWPTTRNGVSYLENSVLPGRVGNSIFYGHNWPNLLGGLKNVKRGDTIELKYPTGEIKTFTIDLITEMPAKHAQVTLESDQKIMTIYTCSGFLDSKRIIVTANYSGSII